MKKSTLLLGGLVLGVDAFPPTRFDALKLLLRQDSGLNETNCGPTPCVTYNPAEQAVDTTGIHVFRAPRPEDIRGPCPGLNAAANHGYLPRNGLSTIEQAITGLEQVYGMGQDLSGLLAAYAVAMDGDVGSETFSIGGPYPGTVLHKLHGAEEPQGLSYSHNNFEGDSSTTRSDAYMNNGDAHSLNLTSFHHLFYLGEEIVFNGTRQINYFPPGVRSQFKYSQDISIANNPYYFSAPFSGLLAVPAAHMFVIALFSNHTALRPNAYLEQGVLTSFFGVTGNPRALHVKPTPLKYFRGHEQIPTGWHRRPLTVPYGVADMLADLVIGYQEDPSTFRLGGNTGTPNSFEGVSISALTGGTYSEHSILQGNNLGCFAIQAMQAGLPDVLKGFLGDISPALDLVGKYAAPVLAALDCPKLNKYNQGLFNRFPGYKYNPKGKDRNYRG